MKTFVLTDIHGCCQELNLLLDRLPIEKDSRFIFLGDYIDRGPDSKGVIDTILKLEKDYEVISLMGNHEELFLDFLHNNKSPGGAMFVLGGGTATLESYSENKNDHFHIPKEHFDFFKKLKLFYEDEYYFFVHAGVPNLPLNELDIIQHKEAFLWIRSPFLNNNRKWEKMIIHGHTPNYEVEKKDNRINLDTACVFKGKLTALELPAKKYYSVDKLPVEYTVDLTNPALRKRSLRFKSEIPIHILTEDNLYQFVTSNFSETGMLIRDCVHNEKVLFKNGEIIRGKTGDIEHQTLHFAGKVVRNFKDQQGVHFAIEFTQPPEPYSLRNGKK